MAFIKCPDCGKEISASAKACPNCGYDMSSFEFCEPLVGEGIEFKRYIGFESSIKLPNNIIGIGIAAFKNCNTITNVDIPNGVKRIGVNAFCECISLRDIRIPKTVTSIGDAAFSGCERLSSILYDGTIEEWCSINFEGVLGNPMEYAKRLLLLDKNGTIQFNDNKYSIFESKSLKLNIKKVGQYSFSGLKSLESIEIPNGVTSIGDSAFRGCTSLSNVKIPNTVTSIDDSAFAGCYSLSNVQITNTVTSKGKTASRKSALSSNIQITNTVTSIGDSAFEGCYSLSNVQIPNTVTSIGDSAFASCKSLSNIKIPNTVTTIGNRAFAGCESLSNVQIPNGVTSIGDRAFSGCNSLGSIIIPCSVSHMGGKIFGDVTKIKVLYEGSREPSTWDKFWLDYDHPGHYVVHRQVVYNYKIENSSSMPTKANNSTLNSPTLNKKNEANNKTQNLEVNNPKNDSSTFIIPPGTTEVLHSLINENNNKGQMTNLYVPSSVVKFSYSWNKIGSCLNPIVVSFNNVYYDGTIEDWCKIIFDDLSANPLQNKENVNFYLKDSKGNVSFNGNKYKLVNDIVLPDGKQLTIGFYSLFGVNFKKTIYGGAEYIGSLLNPYFILYQVLTGTKELNIHKDCKFLYTDCCCDGVKKSYIKNLIIPDNVEFIFPRAFSNNNTLLSVSFPPNIVIYELAFCGCELLSNIKLSDNTNIKRLAFADTNLSYVIVPDSVSYCYNSFSASNSKRKKQFKKSILKPNNIKYSKKVTIALSYDEYERIKEDIKKRKIKPLFDICVGKINVRS